MKKITFAILFALSQLSFAQPVLNATDFPTSYTAQGFAAAIGNFSVGAAGENIVWDYSNATLNSASLVYSIIPASEVTSSTFFPQANFCEKFVYNNGTPHYQLYTLSNQTFEWLAQYDPSFATTDYSYNTGIIFNFPYTYPNEFTDDIWFWGSQFPPEPITRKYDAYGTLITPYGTFSNVIRRKSTFGMGQVTYSWIATNPYRILLEASFISDPGSRPGSSQNVNVPESVYFYIDTTLAISHQETVSKFNLFPNPTTDSFSISGLAEEKLNVNIYDISGKLILEKNNYTVDSSISLKEYANGVYIVKVTDSNNKILLTEKLVKK